jgi:hypothetical protein
METLFSEIQLPSKLQNKTKNIVLITSIINIENTPLSYSKIRSVYNKEQRYEQTLKTIESIRKNIPDSKILFVESSELEKNMEENIIKKSDYYLNLIKLDNFKFYTNNRSKSLGEGYMTIQALKYLKEIGIDYENLFKISGRYYLNNKFKYEEFNNNYNNFKKINNNSENIFTCFFKLKNNYVDKLLLFLQNNFNNMIACMGYEVLFGIFLKEIEFKNIKFIDIINIEGNVSVCGTFYSG